MFFLLAITTGKSRTIHNSKENVSEVERERDEHGEERMIAFDQAPADSSPDSYGRDKSREKEKREEIKAIKPNTTPTIQ